MRVGEAESLEECGVETGATLRLILALRGGPINTRDQLYKIGLPGKSILRDYFQENMTS